MGKWFPELDAADDAERAKAWEIRKLVRESRRRYSIGSSVDLDFYTAIQVMCHQEKTTPAALIRKALREYIHRKTGKEV